MPIPTKYLLSRLLPQLTRQLVNLSTRQLQTMITTVN